MSKLGSIVDRTYEAFNARDFDHYRELLDEDVELVMSGVPVRGRAAVTDFVTVTARARPGLRIEPLRVFVEAGDLLVTEVRMIDTTAAGSTEQASAVESAACGLYRVADGRIVEWRVYIDPAGEDLASQALMAVAAEQSALRRVAELVARHAPPEDVFALVTEELSHLLGVHMVRTVRFEPDGSATVLAARGRAEERVPPGTNVPIPAAGVLDQVLRTGRPARVDDYARVGGPVGALLREEKVRCGAGGPIVVDGRLWGAMLAGSQTADTLPAGSEDRVARFAELVSTAISNIESRAQVERLAAEQAALRRVAELVARHAPPEQVFALVAEELSRLLEVDMVWAVRFEPDGTATIVAGLGTEDQIPVGTNLARPAGTVIDQVFRSGAPTRVERYGEVRGAIGEVLRAEGARCGAGGPIYVDGRLWGAVAVASTLETFPSGTEERVARFAALTSTAISNLESRAKVERLAAEQAALRRVAELVARHAPAEQIFALVSEELSRLFDVDLVGTVRFEPDGSATVLASRGPADDRLSPGTNVRLEGGTVTDLVLSTGRPARVDDYARVPGLLGDVLRQEGAYSGAGGPIVVNGRVWGAMVVGSTARTLAPGTEDRVAQFAELVSTAISNIESRAEVERLAAEQSALRRVATLVAREHSPEQLFATLAEELGTLLDVDAASILRYEADATATVVAGWSAGAIRLPLGERLPLEGANLAGEVLRTGRPQRKEDYSQAAGPIAATVRDLGIRAAVASPIVVEGATWGVIAVLSRKQEPLPPDFETRLAEFSRHAGMAVANAKSRSDLAESRARIVRAGDEARRRLERDLHDGAQQRLVSLGLELAAAEATVPPELSDVRHVLSGLGSSLSDVLDELRELSRGLHPAALSEGGLSPALRSMARRSAVPVDLRLDLDAERFEEPVEVAAYYVAAEALTNTVKHAHASRAEVRVRRRDGWLELIVSDDGRGGAEASRGSGLTGLVDRVEAIGGTIRIDSPPNGGTAVRAKLPTARTV